MSMDKKLTSAVYAAVEKAYDHRCDIEDAADEILEIIEADRKRRGQPVAWIQRTYLNLIRESNVALHNAVVRGSILDGDGDVVPLFTAPQPAEPQECGCCGRSDGCDPDCDAVQPAEPVKVPSGLPVTEQEEEAWQQMEKTNE